MHNLLRIDQLKKAGKSAPIGAIIGDLLTSPDYKFKDFLPIVKN